MQLSEFLKNASENNEIALVEANNYTVTTGKLIEATTVNGLLTDFKLISSVKACADNPQHPAHDTCLGVYTGLLGNHPFNVIVGTLAGDRAIAQLNELPEHLPEHTVAINQFKDLMMWLANTVTYPFANVTLHDVLIERKSCPTKPVTQISGWVTINTNADAPLHNPRLLAKNPRTEQWQWAGNFRGVAAAGTYDVQVPRQWLNADLAVDDAYGVIV